MHVSSLFFALGVLGADWLQDAPRLSARAAYEAAAPTLESIEYGDILAGRLDAWLGHDAIQPALAELLKRRDPIDELTPLLTHADPHVRTLALIALYDREEPQLLPRFRALAGDDAPSYPTPRSSQSLPNQDQKPPLQPCTVGDWARQIVDYYLQRAGYPSLDTVGEPPRFDGYWKARADRAHCASWFLAMAQYPESTGVYLRELERWRGLVRDSIARWEPAAAK